MAFYNKLAQVTITALTITAMINCSNGKKGGGGGGAAPCKTVVPGMAGLTDDEELDDSDYALLEEVTYEGYVKSLVSTNCNCHQAAQVPSLATYNDVSINATSALASMKSRSSLAVPHQMPKTAPLPDDQIQKFEAWINGGKLQNPSGTAGTGLTVISYEGQIKNYIAQSCTMSCHNGTSVNGKSNYTTWLGVQPKASTIVSQVTLKQMPPPTAPQLSPQAVSDFQLWQQGGFQQTSTAVTTPLPTTAPGTGNTVADCKTGNTTGATPTPTYTPTVVGPGGVVITPTPTPMM